MRHLDLVARLKSDVFGRIAPELSDIENFHFAAAQEADPLLIGEIIESAGGIDRSEQSHVFGELNARRAAHCAADVNETCARLH